MSKLATNKFKWTFSSTGRETTRFGIVIIKSSVFLSVSIQDKILCYKYHSLCSLAWLSSSKSFEKVCSQCWQSICFGWDLLVWFSNSSSERKVSLHFLQKPFIPSRSSSSSSLSSSSHHGGHVFYLCFCLFSIFSSFFQISNSGRLSLHCTANLLWPFTDCNFT